MKLIGGHSRERFLQVSEMVLEKFLTLPGNPDPTDTGCYICIRQKAGPGFKILLIAELGDYGEGRAFNFCQEKLTRLFANSDHISSWQSRNRADDRYGGAITPPADSYGTEQGKNLGGSISGLVEMGDEAIILVIFLYFHWITLRETEMITAISNNTLFRPLLDACANLFK